MTDYIQAWQCIGCGKIEAPQPCIGVCKDRKVFMVGKDEHERVLAENQALRIQLERAHAMLQRFGLARPREGQWESSWNALQAQLREALALLAGMPEARAVPGESGKPIAIRRAQHA
jgi:hypothetical protein